jgi:hypothetical protein
MRQVGAPGVNKRRVGAPPREQATVKSAEVVYDV